MKKHFITSLSIFISVSLLGLVAIQIYWIKNSIALRDAQFRYNVKHVLADVANIIYEENTRKKLEQHNMDDLYFGYDSLSNSAGNNDDGFIHRDTTIILGNEKEFRLDVSSNSQTGEIRQSSAIISTDNSVERPDTPEDDTSKSLLSPERRFDRQTKIITNLISNIMQLEFNPEYEVAALDSLIASRLMEVGGIETDFEFGIFDAFNEPEVISSTEHETVAKILNSGYQRRLATNEFNPSYLKIWFPDQTKYLIQTLWPLLFTSALLMLIIVIAFAYTISTIFKQKKISEIKNDFINNMTHELKTPIATISLACEALADPDMIKSPTKSVSFVRMINDENKRLGILVENVLRSAVLDRGEMGLNNQEINLNKLLKEVVKNIEIQVSKKNGQIKMQLNAENAVIIGDKVHLTNVFYNLLDNAIKYSSDNPEIIVKTCNKKESVLLQFIDNGIGIDKENQEKIFDKLYRVPTGNIHNIKGFGLGLSYVKVIVEKHQGKVSVKSELGKGSTFTIQLPIKNEF